MPLGGWSRLTSATIQNSFKYPIEVMLNNACARLEVDAACQTKRRGKLEPRRRYKGESEGRWNFSAFGTKSADP